MKQYYESEVLFQLMERDGLNIPSSVPPYESEIKAYLINQVKQAYPKLTDYEAEWLLYNYTKHLPADFPISSATDVTVATFENVVPYAYQNAILKGQTTVNLLEQFLVGCSYDSKTGIYTSTKNEWIEPVKTSQNVNVNVPYTLFAKVNTTSNNIYIRLDYNSGAIAKDSIINGSVTPNSDIFIKTTVVFSKKDRIRFVLRDTYDGIVKMSNIMLIEGDYTNQDIRFFEGMQSVRMPVLTTVGKNLAYLEQGYINSENGKDASHKGSIRTNYISIDPQLRYTIYGLNEDASSFLAFYDCNKNFISRTSGGKRKDMVIIPTTTPTNARYVRLTNYGSDENSVTLDTPIMIEQGYPTSYEPFKSNILSTSEEVTLCAIGDVKDELDCLTGEMTQRIREVVLDGSGSYNIGGGSNDNYIEFICSVNPKSKRGSVLCDKVFTPSGGHQNNVEYIRATESGIIGYILKTRLSTPDVDGLKAWLSSNNVTIQYQLATPIIKTVELTTVNENGESVHFMPLEGTMNVHSSGEIIPPTFDMSVPVEATTQNLASFIDLQMEE